MDSHDDTNSNSELFTYIHNNWDIGYRDGSNNISIKKLYDLNYLMGWYQGKGFVDGAKGIVSIDFKLVRDPLLFHGYFRTFRDRQYEMMFEN